MIFINVRIVTSKLDKYIYSVFQSRLLCHKSITNYRLYPKEKCVIFKLCKLSINFKILNNM